MADRTLLLGLDTSGDGGLALAQLHADGTLALLAQAALSPRQQSAELLPKLALLLESAHAELSEVAAIVVVSGPGSFTGLRIGLSAAKGLAEAASIPVIAVSSLAALASSAGGNPVAVIDAGRGGYYVRRPSLDDGGPVESLESETTLLAAAGGSTVVVGDAALAEKFSKSASITEGKTGAFTAIAAALPRFHARSFADIATLDANYVRGPYTGQVETTKNAP